MQDQIKTFITTTKPVIQRLESLINIKANHEDAYEFTIYINTKDNLSSVVNVL